MALFKTAVMIVLQCALAGVLNAGYYAYEPSWDGYIIWGGELKTKDVLLIDPSKMILRGSGTATAASCKYVLGMASCAGIREIYWRLDDGAEHLLYPSKDKKRVLKLPNMGVDFSQTDIPLKAYALAKELGLEMLFVVDRKYLTEAKNKYSNINVISSDEIRRNNVVTESEMLDKGLMPKLASSNLSAKKLLFRKNIVVDEQLQKATLCVTAKHKYKVYLDGQLIGEDADWWTGETYNITKLLGIGKHVLALEVEPGVSGECGLLSNVKLTDKKGFDKKICTDNTWLCSDSCEAGWNALDYYDEDWDKAFTIGYDGCIPWMRLNRPWQNEIEVSSSASNVAPMENVGVWVSQNAEIAGHMVDSSVSDRSSWYGKVPCEILIDLKVPRPVKEIRIYSGNIEYANNSSGSLSIENYKIEALKNNKWITLVSEAKALPFQGEQGKNFFIRHEFSPESYDKIKLVILSSYDTGLRVSCPDTPCSAERLVYVREISVYGNAVPLTSWKVYRKNLGKRIKCGSPVVESTPIVWNGKLLLIESWQRHWEEPPGPEREFYVRVRDEESNSILTKTMNGFGYASAWAGSASIHVFASKKQIFDNSMHVSHNIYESCTNDLKNWSKPEIVIQGEDGEQIFNKSVCYDGKQFIMAYETLSNQYTSFTVKFAKSTDLKQWQKVPQAVYGVDRYTACPAIRYCDGYYYMLYVQHLKPEWKFAIFLTRSKDLAKWENASYYPVIAPDPDGLVHQNCIHSSSDYDRNCSANGHEVNVSDPDILEWKEKTRIYFTGGCQHWGGLLQYVEYDGTMKEFFQGYYK